MARPAGLPFPSQVLIALVGVGMLGYYFLAEWAAPLPFYSLKYDPEMPYFMNSLALFKGIPYSYIDHPGTPVEVLGSVLLAITRPVTRMRGVTFIPYHIAHPEMFFSMAHGLLTLASLTSMVLLATSSVRFEGRREILGGAAVGACFYAVYPVLALRSLVYWSHNSFVFPFGTAVLLWLVTRLRRGGPIPAATVFAGGALAGILVAVQLYFAAWVFGVIVAFALHAWFCEEGWVVSVGKGALSGIGAALGFLIGFQPVLHRFREFYGWVNDLVFHLGRYGGGPPGILSASTLVENFKRLWAEGASLVLGSAAIAVLVVVAMWARRWRANEDPGWWSASVALLFQLLVLWIAVGKHPGELYLLAVAAVLPLLLALALEAFLAIGGRMVRLSRMVAALVLMGFAVGLGIALSNHLDTVRKVRFAEAVIVGEIEAFSEKSGVDPGQLSILWSYGVPARCNALRFGNGEAGSALSDEIYSVCANEWEYVIWTGAVQVGSQYEALHLSDDWQILFVPEAYLPPATGSIGEVRITDAQTEGDDGRIAVVTIRPEPGW